LTYDNLSDIRVRVKNYGKWFLPPDTFNRNFDNLKNVVTPEHIELLLIKRIKEVKDQAKRDGPASTAHQPTGSVFNPKSTNDILAAQAITASTESVVKKKSGVQQEREILNNLEAITDSLKQNKKKSPYNSLLE
jgi:hypothetical protein